MQTAALLAAPRELGVAAAAVLIVAERAARGQLRDEELEAAAKRAGRGRRGRTLTLKSRVRLRLFSAAFLRVSRRIAPTSRLRSSICSSTSSSRWEKERKRRSSRSTSVAEGRLRALIAACWASIAFSRAPKAAVMALCSVGLSISACAISPIACSARARRPSCSYSS